MVSCGDPFFWRSHINRKALHFVLFFLFSRFCSNKFGKRFKIKKTLREGFSFYLRRGRDSNPRYRFMPVQRFSKPALSATQAPLLNLEFKGCKSNYWFVNGKIISGRTEFQYFNSNHWHMTFSFDCIFSKKIKVIDNYF